MDEKEVPRIEKVEFLTKFLDKFWRNDRRNLQCFPYCPKFGDYKRHKQHSADHGAWPNNYCHQPVEVLLQADQIAGLLVYGRFREVSREKEGSSKKRKRSSTVAGEEEQNSDSAEIGSPRTASNSETVDDDKNEISLVEERNCPTYSVGQVLSKSESEILIKYYDYLASLVTKGFQGAVYRFNPNHWKYVTKLPKTRSAIVSTRYCFEVLVAFSNDNLQSKGMGDFMSSTNKGVSRSTSSDIPAQLKVLYVAQSTTFQIANTRSLLRTKVNEIREPYMWPGPKGDTFADPSNHMKLYQSPLRPDGPYHYVTQPSPQENFSYPQPAYFSYSGYQPLAGNPGAFGGIEPKVVQQSYPGFPKMHENYEHGGVGSRSDDPHETVPPADLRHSEMYTNQNVGVYAYPSSPYSQPQFYIPAYTFQGAPPLSSGVDPSAYQQGPIQTGHLTQKEPDPHRAGVAGSPRLSEAIRVPLEVGPRITANERADPRILNFSNPSSSSLNYYHVPGGQFYMPQPSMQTKMSFVPSPSISPRRVYQDPSTLGGAERPVIHEGTQGNSEARSNAIPRNMGQP